CSWARMINHNASSDVNSDAALLSQALAAVDQLSIAGLQQLFNSCSARLSRLLDPLCGTRLPPELQDRLLGLLAPGDLANCRLVCSRWRRRIDEDDGLWLRLGRRLGLRDPPGNADGSAAEKPELARRRVARLLGDSHLTCSEVAFGPDLGAVASDGASETDEDHERTLVGLTVHSNPFSSSDAELLLDYFEPSTQRVRFRRLHVSGFSPAGRANANARANGYCRDSQLAVLVAGPAGGGLHAVVSLADAGTTLASVDATPLAFIRLTDGERVSATAAHVCGACGRVQVLLLTSLNRLLLWSLPPQPRPSPNASTQWCQSQPQPPVLQVPDAAATLHSDAGDLFRRNRLISVGPTRLANQRQFYYAALTRRESLVTVVEVGCRSIRLTDRLTWQRPLKGFLRWSRPAVATATECRQLVTMAIKAHVGLSERRSSLLVVRHRVLDGGDHQAGKLVMEESFEYERTFQSEDILLCGYGAKFFAILGISASVGLGLALHRPGWRRPLSVIGLSSLLQMVLLEPLCVPLPAPWAAPSWFDDGLDASPCRRQPLLLLATGTRGHLLLSWRFEAPPSDDRDCQEIDSEEAVEKICVRSDFVHCAAEGSSSAA
ncbi:hypothetical protein BOX15_Mlig031503g3, partial [Macrostomum lignano]